MERFQRLEFSEPAGLRNIKKKLPNTSIWPYNALIGNWHAFDPYQEQLDYFGLSSRAPRIAHTAPVEAEERCDVKLS